MNWQHQVQACFGAADLKWGSHPLDQQRARDMLKAAIDAGATMTDIVAQVEEFLQGKGAEAQHIRDQLIKVRNLSF